MASKYWHIQEEDTNETFDDTDPRIGTDCACGGKFDVIVSKRMRNGADWHQLQCSSCEGLGLNIPCKVNHETVGEFKMPLGKHAGKTLKQIYDDSPDYLSWVVDNFEGNSIRRKVEVFLETMFKSNRIHKLL